MFGLKAKVKNVGFWLSLSSAVIMFLQSIGITVNGDMINQIVSAFCGILVVLGIVSNPKEGAGFTDKIIKNKSKKI